MLKKIHKSSLDLSCDRKESYEWSMCRANRPLICHCDSTPMLCDNCQVTVGKTRLSQDGGDYLSEKKCEGSGHQLQKCHPKSVCAHTKDLASGDHHKHNLKRKAKSECKIKFCKDDGGGKTKTCAEHIDQNEELETIIEYKNANFEDNKSSTSSLVSTSSQRDLEDVVESSGNHVCPRPVTCPIQDCSKMIALDSVMLHFYFDHSKIPRQSLNGFRSEILIKPSSISSDVRCLAVFLLQNKKQLGLHKNSKSILSASNSDCKSILLMGARIQTDKLKDRDGKTNTISLRDVTTQTVSCSKVTAKKKSNVTLKSKKSESYKALAQEEFDTNEFLMLWFCKLDDCMDVYNITLHKNKKLSYSYSGEAIHIREDQLPEQMYQKADCLILTGTAANKLLDGFNQISIVVNVLV